MIRSWRGTASVRAVLSGVAALLLVGAAQHASAANRVVVGTRTVKFEWMPSSGTPDGYLVSRTNKNGPLQAYAWVTSTSVEVAVVPGDQIAISVAAGGRDTAGAFRLGPASPLSDRVWVLPAPSLPVDTAFMMRCASCPSIALRDLGNASSVLAEAPALAPPWRPLGHAMLDSDSEYLIWQNAFTGEVQVWDAYYLEPIPGWSATGPLALRGVGAADFDRDGTEDFVTQRTDTNEVQVWGLTANGFRAAGVLPAPPNGRLVAVGDFATDGVVDVLWHDAAAGTLTIQSVVHDPKTNPSRYYAQMSWRVMTNMPVDAVVAGKGDYDGDGHLDLVWSFADGRMSVLYLIRARMKRYQFLPAATGDLNRSVVSSVDADGVPGDEIVLQDRVTKAITIAYPSITTFAERLTLLNPGAEWKVVDFGF